MRKFIKSTGRVLGTGILTVGHIVNSGLIKSPGIVLNTAGNVLGAELDRLGDKVDGKMVKPRKVYRKLRVRDDEYLNKVLTGKLSAREYVDGMVPDFIKSGIAMSKEAVDKQMQGEWMSGRKINVKDL